MKLTASRQNPCSPDTATSLVVGLCGQKRGRWHTKLFCVHWLVAAAFLGKKAVGRSVCHNDGNPYNNMSSNLRYDTHAANMADSVRHGTSGRGVENGMNVLTEAKAREIKNELKGRVRGDIARVARAYDINYSTVRAIANGINWGWL